MTDRPTDSPPVMGCPPLVFLGAFGLGLLCEWALPVQPLPLDISRWLGMWPCLASAVISFWAAIIMWRAGTPLRPTLPVKALVTHGPFRFTRNPLYLSMTLLYVGLTLQFDALWPLVILVPMVIIVHRKIILREEKYLEAKFGDEYRAYKARVRRWI